jgi:hypothetical protein
MFVRTCICFIIKTAMFSQNFVFFFFFTFSNIYMRKYKGDTRATVGISLGLFSVGPNSVCFKTLLVLNIEEVIIMFNDKTM